MDVYNNKQVIETVQSLTEHIQSLDKADEQYKIDKQENINALQELKTSINEYCDVNVRLQYILCGIIGFALGIIVMVVTM